MKGIVDRFEGKFVVVEIDGNTSDFPREIFPPEVQIGDVVQITNDSVRVLKDETEKLRIEIEELMKEVWED